MTPSRREFVQVTGLAVVGVVAGTGWTSSAQASPRLQGVSAAQDAGTRATTTLFPWIGF